MSSRSQHDDLARFITAVQARLYANRLARAATTGAWLTALVLLVLGAIHVGLAAVTVRFWLGTAGLVFLLAMGPALLARPSQIEAARMADRCFGARGLLATSVGVRATPANRAALAIVNEQARQFSAGCRDSLRQRLPGPSITRAAQAAVPLFAAVVLLLQPGIQPVPPTPEASAGAPLAATTSAPPEAADNELDVARLREQLAVSTMPGAADGHSAPVPAAGPALDAGKTLPAGDVLADTGVDVPAASPGDEAGLAPGRVGGEQSLPPARLATAAPFDVAVTGDSLATVPSTGRDFDNTASPGATDAVRALPADPPAPGAGQAMFTRAQAAYAGRYLAATGNHDD